MIPKAPPDNGPTFLWGMGYRVISGDKLITIFRRRNYSSTIYEHRVHLKMCSLHKNTHKNAKTCPSPKDVAVHRLDTPFS